MAECKDKKRLQIYLDGWMNEVQSARFEEHLRNCADCLSELVDLEEISSAALEIVDHAPEREYWDSFATRVKNRIFAREANPYTGKKKAGFRLKIASYSVSIVAVAAALMLTFGMLSDKPDIVVVEDELSETNVSELAGVVESELSGAADVVQQDVSSDLLEIPAVTDPSHGKVEKTGGSKPSFADTPPLPAGDGAGPPENGAASVFERDYATAFRSPMKVDPAPVEFSDSENFLSRLLAAYGDYSGDDFSLNPNIVTEGIMTGYALGSTLERGPSAFSYMNGIIGPENRISPGWGYLGLPGDTASTAESRRYLIELELMQLK